MPASFADPAVALDSVTVRYGPLVAVDDVSLSIAAGERVALIGPSGSGKSSLLGVIATMVTPSTGGRSVLGADPAALRGRARRRHQADVGLVSQGLDLVGPLRVVHNVNAGRLGRWNTLASLWSLVRPSQRHCVERALDAVGLADRIDDTTDALSGGERQRVAVARVLVQQPALVVADEPVSSVDPRLSHDVLALLCEQGRWTCVVSLHQPELAVAHCDRIIGLRDGAVAFDRPAAEVTDDEIRALYRRGEPPA